MILKSDPQAFAGETLLSLAEIDILRGFSAEEIEKLAKTEGVLKAGVRELPVVIARKQTASTTVSATARLASLNGVPVFATGGIGGVHRGFAESFDISSDLTALADGRLYTAKREGRNRVVAK